MHSTYTDYLHAAPYPVRLRYDWLMEGLEETLAEVVEEYLTITRQLFTALYEEKGWITLHAIGNRLLRQLGDPHLEKKSKAIQAEFPDFLILGSNTRFHTWLWYLPRLYARLVEFSADVAIVFRELMILMNPTMGDVTVEVDDDAERPTVMLPVAAVAK